MTNTKTAINANRCKIENFSIVTFMQPAYFNLEKSYHDTVRHMYVFVHDKSKMGVMTDKQKSDVLRIIRYYIPYDYPIRNIQDINIAPFFEMADTEGFDSSKEVNIGIYDLDNDKILASRMRWDAQHPCINPRCADESDDMRIALYTECEAIGRTL